MRMPLFLPALLAAFAILVTPSGGHEPGPEMLQVELGKTVVYSITADITESQPSDYSTLQSPDPAIAELISAPAFSDYNTGDYRIEGKAVGETTATFGWSYTPTGGSGFFQVTIQVVPKKPRRRSTSGVVGDPTNTSTLEFFSMEDPDLYLHGPMPLYFRRYYGSRIFAEGTIRSPLGNNWMHNFDQKAERIGDRVFITFFPPLDIEFEKNGADWKLVEPTEIPFQLREDGADLVLLNPQDWIRYRFDNQGRLRAVFDRNGNQHTVEYAMVNGTETNRIARVSDGLGRELLFTTAGFERLMSVADGSGPGSRTVSFNISFDRELRAVTDPMGRATQFTYDNGTATGLWGANFNQSAALLTSRTLPEGNTRLVVEYNPDGTVFRQLDASGDAHELSRSGGTTTIEDPFAGITAHVHDSDGRLTSYSEPGGAAASFTYDAGGRREGTIDKLGDASGVTYHLPSGRVASRTDAEGNTVVFNYTPQIQDGFTFFNLTAISYEDGATMEYTYDPAGNLLTSEDRDGRTTSFTYNARGQVTNHVRPGGESHTYTYDSAGRLATGTDDAATTAYGYDSKHRLMSITHPDATTRIFSYDANDRMLTAKDELNRTTTYAYDMNGNLSSITDAMGETFSFTYDDRDLLHTAVNERMGTTTYQFDALGRLSRVNQPTGETMTVGYTADGFPETLTDANGDSRTVLFDLEGVPSGIIDPLGRQWIFTTNKLGLLEGTETPLGHVTTYGYDPLGNLISVTNTEGGTTTYDYDDSGLVTGITLPDGAMTWLGRGASGLIDSLIDPDGNVWRRSYDAEGRLAGTTDPLGRTTGYSYTPDGVPALVTFPAGLGTMNTTYDDTGRVTRKQYSAGLTIDYAYDYRGLLETANGVAISYDVAGSIVGCNGQTMTRDIGGRMLTVEYAPGKTVNYSYNSVGLLDTVTDWVGGTTQFMYDDAAQLTWISRPNGSMTGFGYDPDGRLVSIEEENGARAAITLTLDGEGRLITADRDLPMLPDLSGLFHADGFTFDSAYQGGMQSFDPLGRFSSDGTRSCMWDPGSRLSQYTNNGSSWTFTYDAFGCRLSCNDGTTRRDYLNNYGFGLPSCTQISDGTGPLMYYIYTPGGRLLHGIDAMTDARCYHHFDEMGHATFLTNDANAVTDAYSVTPYGERIGHNGTSENPFIYCGSSGCMTDDSGLIWMRSRYYDPERCSFLCPDGIQGIHPQQANPYQYALGNPLGFTHPTGRGPEEPGMASLFTPDNPSFISDAFFTTVETVFENSARNSADEAIKSWRLFPRNQPIPNLSDATRLADRAQLTNTLGNVAGFAIDGYSEFSQARKEGKGVAQSLGRGALGGTVSVAIGTASAPVALIDGVTGENFSHSIKQVYRVTEAMLGTESDARALRRAAGNGDLGALVQVTDFAGGQYADKGIGGVFGEITTQGFMETVDAWGFALFGAPEPYVLPESARRRIDERRERQRQEALRQNRQERKRRSQQ